MTMETVRSTLKDDVPPASLPLLVEAMWWEAKGEWKRSHAMVDELATRNAAWVHAYLHRCEGDLGNASYWYGQAGRPVSGSSLEQEWGEIVEELLRSAGTQP